MRSQSARPHVKHGLRAQSRSAGLRDVMFIVSGCYGRNREGDGGVFTGEDGQHDGGISTQSGGRHVL